MKKWQNLLEFVQFPLKLLIMAVCFLGIGTFLVNPNLGLIYRVDNQNLIIFAQVIRFLGGIMIKFIPLLIFIKILSKRFESTIPVFVGVVAIITFNVSMMFFVDPSFPSHYYTSFLGLSFDMSSLGVGINSIVMPYNTGIVSLVIMYYLIKFTYKKSRHYSMHGILSFMDHDSWFMLTTIIGSVFLGISVAFLWPFVIQLIEYIYQTLATDITNPLYIGLYSILERISALFDMVDIPRNIFWFTDAGGSWMDIVGTTYVGDVSIWTVQNNMGLTLMSAGRFTGFYYLINMFIIPAFILGYYSLTTSKADKKRYRLFVIGALVISILCGNPLPFELAMLVLSPILYLAYLLVIGVSSSFLSATGGHLGYMFSENLVLANPGSGLDLFAMFRNPELLSNILMLIFCGIICAIVFYILTIKYFKKYALGLVEVDAPTEVTENMILALGGKDNLISIDSTPDKITVSLVDKNVVNFDQLQENGAYLVLDSKDGYLIRLERGSTMICDEMRKQLGFNNNEKKLIKESLKEKVKAAHEKREEKKHKDVVKEDSILDREENNYENIDKEIIEND